MGYQLNNNKATDLYGMYLERPNKKIHRTRERTRNQTSQSTNWMEKIEAWWLKRRWVKTLAELCLLLLRLVCVTSILSHLCKYGSSQGRERHLHKIWNRWDLQCIYNFLLQQLLTCMSCLIKKKKDNSTVQEDYLILPKLNM
jgi:hypothetical protein